MNFTNLPHDILILIFESLAAQDLIALSLSSPTVHALILEYGWTSYLRVNPRPSWSLAKARSHWSPQIQAIHDTITDANWAQANLIARPLSRMWPGKLQPIMAINNSRLVVGAGNTIYSYSFSNSGDVTSPSVAAEGKVTLLDDPEKPKNITSLTFLQDDRTFLVAFQDGLVERVTLESSSPNSADALSAKRTLVPFFFNEDSFVENICSESNIVLSLSSSGSAKLCKHQDNEFLELSSLELKTRSWTSYLSLSSTPFAAFGTASRNPLNIHLITESQLSPTPSAILHTSKAASLPMEQLPSSAVYGISKAPLNSPWGSSPQIIVSGWYDGQVRCYDLRSSSRFSGLNSTGGSLVSALKPVLSLADRWSYDPIYSVSCGGGSASYIAAGTARHSRASFWDVRSPSFGWTVHAPGNDPSPVYSVILESSRFFGATQSRAFVYDFGPGVSLSTYPHIPPVRGIDGLKQKKGSHHATYHVSRYNHMSLGI